MSRSTSAGLLLYRWRGATLEVLLAHPGGPFWARRDAGAWSIPKGEVGDGEEPADVARREFREETGQEPPPGPAIDLGEARQRSGKLVRAWGLEGDLDPAVSVSNTFEMEWPPGSGRRASFPEVDRVEWFPLEEALRRINPGQAPLLLRLRELVPSHRDDPARREPMAPKTRTRSRLVAS
ncbi:MAG TPA: NUDIX domain-containing protein, partial [Candidatus Limnocylindrales bacterium]|nr:NUDIX domain-containing protein [Candidatus Limnocylindrales bacterium]